MQTASPPPSPQAVPLMTHPMDTSWVLRSLMELARGSEQAASDPSLEQEGWIVSPWTLKKLLSAIHYRDAGTILHSRRVALLAVGIGRRLGWDEELLRRLEIAAVLHDIGKIGVPDHILRKPARLSPDEHELVITHQLIGVDLLQACRIDREVVDLILHSHTHGRIAEEHEGDAALTVPQGSRILAVADAYDSLRNTQVYRRGKSHEEAMHVLDQQSGREFDRNVVAALNRWILEDGQAFLAENPLEEMSLNACAPIDEATVRHARSLCLALSSMYVLETLYDGFCIVDSDLRFVVWNHGMQKLTSTPARLVAGEHWSQKLLRFTNQEKSPLVERDCPLHQVLTDGQYRCATLKLENRRRAEWHDVECEALPLKGDDGKLQGIALIVRDVTRSKSNPDQFRELQMAARRDPLTGVGNRGELESRLARMFKAREEQSEPRPLSVIFLDIDHFKSINDTHGHSVGDQVLIDLARLAEDELYSGETICRYGGEEFVVLCPDTPLQDAIQRAERLRRAISGRPLGGKANLHVTSSFGVSEVGEEDSPEKLLHRADEALYEAKTGGRNKTCYRSIDAEGKEAAAGSADEPPDPFLHIGEFTARVAADMVLFKLSGFIDDFKISLKKIQQHRFEMQLGRTSMFGGWSTDASRQPVKMVLEIGQPKQIGRWSSRQVAVKATISPIGSCKNAEHFQIRATQVMRDLRAYFAAD